MLNSMAAVTDHGYCSPFVHNMLLWKWVFPPPLPFDLIWHLQHRRISERLLLLQFFFVLFLFLIFFFTIVDL